MVVLTSRPLVKDIKIVSPENLAGDKIPPGHPLFGVAWINPARMSGAPCFYGSRVPLKNLFDSLVAGETLDDFLDGFPGVAHEQATAVLSLAVENLFNAL